MFDYILTRFFSINHNHFRRNIAEYSGISGSFNSIYVITAEENVHFIEKRKISYPYVLIPLAISILNSDALLLLQFIYLFTLFSRVNSR